MLPKGLSKTTFSIRLFGTTIYNEDSFFLSTKSVLLNRISKQELFAKGRHQHSDDSFINR